MRNKLNHILLGLLIGALLMGCSGAKLLNDNQKFFIGTQFKFADELSANKKESLILELEKLVQPTPNVEVLGSRPAVWLYQITSKPKKDKGFKHWLKYKIGKRPILQSDFQEKLITNRIRNHLRNVGYFLVSVQPELKEKNREVKYIFNIDLGPQYTIRDISYPQTDSTYKSLITQISDNSLLRENQPYKLEQLQAEQKRIENYLENKGFYYFDDKYLIYEADSSVGNHQVDLKLTLSTDTPDRAKQIFTFDEIEIDADHSLSNDTSSQSKRDIGEGYSLINDNNYLKPRTLRENILLEQGDVYSEKAETRTRERLIALGIYKFIDLRLTPSDSSLLSTRINLTPLPKKSIRLEAQAVSKSNNFIGPSLSARFQNRNTFRGAELFELKLNGSYEVQVGGQNKPALNAYEVNLEGSLTIPRLVSPFKINYDKVRFMPKTRISLGSRIQQRVNVFQINSFEMRYGFQWRQSVTKQHSLYPVNVSLVQLAQTSSEFDERLVNDINLARSIEDQYIIGALYEYIFSTRNAPKAEKNRHNYYFNLLADVSGNLLNLTERTLNLEEENSDRIPYSQYAKIQTDFRYYRKLGKNKELATRLILGMARAYGNSEDVPFIKQFSAGGSTSIRAFRARSLGPGSFVATDTASLVLDETGDMKLEANMEYRSKIAGILEGALFLDVGNVWLWDARPEKPGGSFSEEFVSELAVGTGAGLRLDFDFFVLRFDLAFPLRKPSLPKGNRWVIGDINPLDRDWRSDNLLLNIAIGYPF